MLCFLILTSLLFSCSAVDNRPQTKFGGDSAFYLALKAADSGNEKEAVRKFKEARKNGTELVAKRSAQSLTMLGSVGDRVSASKYLAKNFPDEESILIACRQLLRNEEYAEIIKITDDIDIKKASNELVELRMLSLIEKEDSRLDTQFYEWFTCRPLSPEHLEIYGNYVALGERQLERIQRTAKEFQRELNRYRIMEQSLSPDYEEAQAAEKAVEQEIEDFITEDFEIEKPRQSIIDYRVAVYRKKYLECFSSINKILKIYENFDEGIDCQLLSDIGKAALYGTSDYLSTARRFERMAQDFVSVSAGATDSVVAKAYSERAYYAYFYAARLYDKAGRRYSSQTVSSFHSALNHYADEMQYDNCLWYLLNFQLRTSVDDIIGTLEAYGSRINSSAYFDDFYESLAVLLLSNHRWQDFYTVWMKTNANYSESVGGKFAYISGRLIEEGLAEGEPGLKTRQAVDAFTKVLSGGGDLYYKVCALERLNLHDVEMVSAVLLSNGKDGENEQDKLETSAGRLLDGYAAFGFPQRIYAEFIANRKSISVRDAVSAAKFLNKCATLDEKNTNEYNVQSLRIADRSYSSAKGKFPLELLQLTFPRFYKSKIEKACAENELPEYLLYALVRSESFFDSQISSSAGACGLTQLMESTASDEARKLKIGFYDILDPETNLRMGAHYLASLVERTEKNNRLLALFAYNAGLTHVRNWVNAAREDWRGTGNSVRGPAGIPTDLFLETLPFAETREYGRKIVSAAALYGWLYEEKLPSETVREILY
ncbi:MAG: lytic transglycosylase domain-containing protein [Treponema sp.]|nr:lytic transglycosylase domain-containing protein [Candidatus Treponema equifaecale]